MKDRIKRFLLAVVVGFTKASIVGLVIAVIAFFIWLDKVRFVY